MNCYELYGDYTSEDFVSCGWSETKEKRTPRPGGYWHPVDSRFLSDGRMHPGDRDRMTALWLRLVGNTIKPLQVIGEFSFLQGKNAAFEKDLALGTRERDPEGIDLIHQPKVWSKIANAPITHPEFYFINILRRIERWDEDETEIIGTRPVDGYYTKFAIRGGTRVLKKSAVQGAWLWRDAKTLHVLCSEEFKSFAEDIGCRGLSFGRVEVSER
ncbi:hypothetical protein K3553_06175 [Leisingera aquaemixtae]|uniref:imm11 family protein n=1 Tax=Leisingera aquaemixtae TaxID=1396826 RepID=UPI0021A62D99|nr:DUF1629 domain-containing protein [Leisingera aquaemixtae]UWQ26042.1 hypothetical protein K3553_06175 [Leisingera aquaemixtae]